MTLEREATRGAWVVALAAAALAAAGLTGGTASLLVCAALALPLASLALRARGTPSRATARGMVVTGLGAGALAAVWLLAGRPLAGAVALAAAIASVWAGARLALASDAASGTLEATSAGVLLATAIDEAALWLRERRAARAARGQPPIDAALCRVVLERERSRGWVDAPERAHSVPPLLEKVVLEPASAPGLGDFECLAFESEWQPPEPELRDAWRAAGESRIARAWMWRQPGAARPALLLVPGHGAGSVHTDARSTSAARLSRELDIDVLLLVLPFHGARAGTGRGGFLHGDPLLVSAVLSQSIWELRRLAGWLRAQGAPSVGVAGVGMGGTLAALLASLDAALACAIPAFAPLSPRSLCAECRREAWATGAGEDVVEMLLSQYSPLRLAPRAPGAGRLVVGARADRFVPAAETKALAAHWQAPLLWLPGGHWTPGRPRRVREAVTAHLRRTLCNRSALADAGADVPLSHFRR